MFAFFYHKRKTTGCARVSISLSGIYIFYQVVIARCLPGNPEENLFKKQVINSYKILFFNNFCRQYL